MLNDVLSLAGRIPPGLLSTGSEAKALLRRAVRPWLPAEALDRPKMGFAMPLTSWITRLEPMFRSADPACEVEAWLDRDLLPRLIDAHTRGSGNHAATIHGISFLRAWTGQWQPSHATVTAVASQVTP